MKLSRGAQRCIKLLRWYAAHFQEVFPYRSTLAKHLNVSGAQLDRYIRELKSAGLLSVSQAGPQPASYHVVAGRNDKAMMKLRQSNDKAFGHSPFNRVTVTQEEMRARFPMEIETPSPEVTGLLEWADHNGYPIGDGAQLETAERAWKLRKPPAAATGHAREASA